MKLCGHSVSPYVERILIALEMKGKADGVVLTDVVGGFKSPEHLSHHPLGKIPFLLLEDGTSLSESQSIVEYLDAVIGGDSVMPVEPMEAAKASRIIRVLDIYYTGAIGPMGKVAFGGTATDEEMADAKERALPEALKYLDFCIEGEQFAVSDSWSHADAAIMSQLYWFERLMPQFGVPGLEDYPTLSAYWENAKKTDIYQASKARADKSVAKFFGNKK